MANDLTGDFDVVAEFSLSAVNRVLAAMHAVGRRIAFRNIRPRSTCPQHPQNAVQD